MARYAKTQTDAAQQLKISRATFIACSKESDFPAETKRGWNLDKIDAWMRANSRGPYRRGSGGEATSVEGATLTEAKIRLTLGQAANERIKEERQRVEQAKELGQILDRGDAEHAVSQMVATARQCIDALHTAVDRAIPEGAAHKESVLGMIAKLDADIFSAMNELW